MIERLLLLPVGDGAVGKTSIISRFISGDFVTLKMPHSWKSDNAFLRPLPALWGRKTITKADGTQLAIDIKEPCYQPSDISLKEQVRRMIDGERFGLLLVYDISRPNSFCNINNHLKGIQNVIEWNKLRYNKSSEIFGIAVVGNKSDLRDSNVPLVNQADGEQYAETISNIYEIPIFFIETSAKTGYNIEQLFSELVSIFQGGGNSD